MTDFEKMMANLQVEYITALDQKIVEVQRALQDKAAVPIQDIFHKLKGTGSTYGVPEISRLGEVLEKLCEERPGQLDSFVPQALLLLKSIQTSRRSGKPYEIADDPGFTHLAHLNKNHMKKA